VTYYGPVAQEAAYLSQLLPGLSPIVAQAWLVNEGQSDSIATPSNPLNIVVRGGGSGSGLETGSNGPLFTYASWQDGLKAVAHLLNANSAYSGILAAIKTGNPQAEARAIELSPWSGGNYGATKTKAGAITNTTDKLLGITGPVDSGAAVAQSATPTTAKLTAAPLTVPGLTGSGLLSEIAMLDATPNLTTKQASQLAADMNALMSQVGSGSAAEDAVTAWLGPQLPLASPALVPASVAAYTGAPVTAATGASLGPVAQPVTAPVAAPKAAPAVVAPMGSSGVSALLVVGVFALAVIVVLATEG
jgi:hypothetical protein